MAPAKPSSLVDTRVIYCGDKWLARVVKKTGIFYYHCDWHTVH